MSITVAGFELDDVNEEKFALHGVTLRQVLQVLQNSFLIVPNRRDRTGLYLLLGRDNGGQCLAIPIQATPEADIWRPITAWTCKEHERARLNKFE